MFTTQDAMGLKPVDEQVVVVFGASSGIGRETVRQFARRGAQVMAAARSESGLASLAAEVEAEGGQIITCIADAASFEEVSKVADLAVERFGRLDTWVHAAAVAIIGPFSQTTPTEFKRVIEVNLLGQVYGAMAALPHLRREGRGALIHITSVEARRSMPLQSAYSASKHGVEGFLESLRVELQHEKIPVSVTNILPGVINTTFYNKARTKLGVKPTSIPPFYQPNLVADAILYAAEHPVRDMIVGDAGRALEFLQRLSPALVDQALLLIGFEGQRTSERKLASDDNNLFEPIPNQRYDRSEGDYGHLAVPSFFDWLDRIPATAKPLLGITALGALALLVGRAISDGHRE